MVAVGLALSACPAGDDSSTTSPPIESSAAYGVPATESDSFETTLTESESETETESDSSSSDGSDTEADTGAATSGTTGGSGTTGEPGSTSISPDYGVPSTTSG